MILIAKTEYMSDKNVEIKLDKVSGNEFSDTLKGKVSMIEFFIRD
jgi:hypothetical protein